MRYAVVLQYRDGHVIESPCESYDEAFALAADEVCGGRDPQLARCVIEERLGARRARALSLMSEAHRLVNQGDTDMEIKEIGHRHGTAVRRVVGFAADKVVALGRDVAHNARRGAGYFAGFAQGLLRPNAL